MGRARAFHSPPTAHGSRLPTPTHTHASLSPHPQLPNQSPDAKQDWWQSRMGIVEPGDVVESHVAFDAKSNAYEMLIGCVAGSNKGWSERSIIPVAPHRGETRRFTNVFFVVEHHPDSC